MEGFPVHPSVLAIVPARGGSKGIPGKNVVPIAGRPLIEWTIQAAHASRFVARVVVSTDDATISEVSSRAGAEVIQRPSEISDDAASSESALLHALRTLEENEGYRPDLVVFLQCTAPLTTGQDIDATISTLLDENADSAVAAVPFHYFVWKRTADGQAFGVNHNRSVRQLRQDREPEFLEAGSVYVMKTEGFQEAEHRFFGRTALYEMPQERCWEVDTPVDLKIAEVLLLERENKEPASRAA